MIFRLVVLHRLRHLVHIVQPHLIDDLNTGFPVAIVFIPGVENPGHRSVGR